MTSHDPLFTAMRAAAASVAVALNHVETSAGAEVSAVMAENMMSIAASHLLDRIGPVAARNAMINVYAALERAIAAQNAGTTALS